MVRKLALSAAATSVSLLLVPTVLGAVRSPSIESAPFSSGEVVTRAWETTAPLAESHLGLGASVSRRLTIANVGPSAGVYRISASATGPIAAHLRLVVASRSDGAVLYSGPATRLRELEVGRLRSGQQVVLALRFTLAPTGSAARDNALQASSGSIAFAWSTTAA